MYMNAHISEIFILYSRIKLADKCDKANCNLRNDVKVKEKKRHGENEETASEKVMHKMEKFFFISFCRWKYCS